MTPGETQQHRDITAPWGLIVALAVLFCVLAVAAGTIGTLPGDEPATDLVQHAQGAIARAVWGGGQRAGHHGMGQRGVRARPGGGSPRTMVA